MTYLIQPGSPFPGSRNWVSFQTQSLWLNNAGQCRRHTGRSSIAAAAALTHEGTYLIYGFLAPISDQGIPVEYELDTFNTLPQEQLYITPKIVYVDAMPYFRSRHLALNSPLDHFNGDNACLFTRHTKLTVTPKFISSNGNVAFAKLWRTQSLARPVTHAAFSTLSYLHFISYSQSFLRDLLHKKQTQYSMLQIKTIPKNISTRTSWTFSFMYLTTISEGLTNLVRKQLNVNTRTLHSSSPNNNNKN